MSSHFETSMEMTCTDFEKSFDAYVDGLLDGAMLAACERHIGCCRACDREVTRWQQARILLSTAVADFATAVDVSSLRGDVEAALGFADAGAPSKRRAVDREASYERVVADRPAGRRSGRGAGREAVAGRRSSFSATLRMMSAAAVSAATAAAAVLLLAPGPQGAATPQFASLPAASSPASSSAPSAYSYQPASLRSGRRVVEDVAPAAYTPPPLARPQVSHVDGLEAAPGHQVATWVQPKTNARVIWVENRGMGAPVRTAGLDR